MNEKCASCGGPQGGCIVEACGPTLDAAIQERDRLILQNEEARKVLSEIQGSLHVINAYASGIRRWIKDPNVDVEGDCRKIEEYRLKIHMAISAVLFPEDVVKRVGQNEKGQSGSAP